MHLRRAASAGSKTRAAGVVGRIPKASIRNDAAEGAAMSDTVLIALIIAGVVIIALFLLRDRLTRFFFQTDSDEELAATQRGR